MKVAVLIRQLPNSRPVTTAIIQEPDTSYGVDDLDHYFQREAENVQRRFTEEFIEFKDAKFYIDIISL